MSNSLIDLGDMKVITKNLISTTWHYILGLIRKRYTWCDCRGGGGIWTAWWDCSGDWGAESTAAGCGSCGGASWSDWSGDGGGNTTSLGNGGGGGTEARIATSSRVVWGGGEVIASMGWERMRS